MSYLICFGRADRLRALVKCAELAARGSDRHWRRLARLDEGTKAAVWTALDKGTKGKLKALKASLESQMGGI